MNLLGLVPQTSLRTSISHKIDKDLGLKGVDITQTGFDQRMVKAVADSTSTSLLQTAVHGGDFEENLKQNLKVQFATVATQETFSNIVKNLDSDTISDNIAHKIAAGLTGCLSAKAAGNACDAGAIGATIGEMWGDWLTDDPNKLTPAQKETIINQAKLLAGITAAYAGENVNVAADMAAEAVRWNATGKHPQQHRKSKKEIFSENSLIAKFGDMIIVNVSGSIYGYTVVVNAKNGNVYTTDKFEISASSSMVTGVATSINFGNVVGGNYSAAKLDEIIKGSSFNMQACYAACAGISKTRTNTIITYGMGTPQVGMSGGSLKYTNIRLSQAEIKRLILRGGN